MGKVIVKKKGGLIDIPDSTKWQVLQMYSQGSDIKAIADSLKLPLESLRTFISNTITDLAVVKEARALSYGPSSMAMKTPISIMNDLWIEKAEQNAEQYAYFYATTGNNQFALEQSELHEDLPSDTSARSTKFIHGARGKFLRDQPDINKLINQYREKKVKDADVGTTLIQSELLQQLDELKELASDDGRARGHLIRVIELLGKTEGAFSETLNVNDTSTKTGMDLLMAKVKERKEATKEPDAVYEVEHVEKE